jgi:HSP20 family protein
MAMMSMRDIVPWDRGGPRVATVFREPTNLFASVQQEMNRLFDEAFRGFGASSPRFGAGWPSIEIAETDKEIRATIEVPGVDEKDIELFLQDGDLVIRGEKRSETEDKDRRFTERSYGRFERRIALQQEVEEDKVGAEFRNGVLTVTIPKSARAEQRVKRIALSTGK